MLWQNTFSNCFVICCWQEKNYHYIFIDYRRNVIKADIGLVRKGQFPMALVEDAHRFVEKNELHKTIYHFLILEN
jgi:hypothetical protein